METLQIEAIPNQSLSINTDGNRYSIRLKEANGTMAIDIDIDGINIISGRECNTDSLLIPYKHLEVGNFKFITENDNLPYYTNFKNSDKLVFISKSELKEARK